MKCLISHATAFEYWRLVGISGIRVPKKSAARVPPASASIRSIEKLAEVGLLSYPLHATTSRKAKRSKRAVYHYRPAPLPLGSIYLLGKDVAITSPELTLVQIASAFTTPEISGLASEFCGFYSPLDDTMSGLVKRDRLASTERLSSFLERAGKINGSQAAARAVRYAFDRSRSPMETAIGLIMTLPRNYGGYAVQGAVVNQRVRLGAADRKATGRETLEPDILWPESKVCVEYDSFEFHSDEWRTSNDARRKNALLSAGYKTVTLTAKQARSSSAMELVARHILKQQGKRQRIPDSERALALRVELLGSSSVLKNQYEPSRRLGQETRATRR